MCSSDLLTYFNFKAVGEPLRLLFVAAGVPFEDERIPGDQWNEVKKTRSKLVEFAI